MVKGIHGTTWLIFQYLKSFLNHTQKHFWLKDTKVVCCPRLLAHFHYKIHLSQVFGGNDTKSSVEHTTLVRKSLLSSNKDTIVAQRLLFLSQRHLLGIYEWQRHKNSVKRTIFIIFDKKKSHKFVQKVKVFQPIPPKSNCEFKLNSKIN